MAVYWFTGTLGAGKSLCAVARAFEYLRAGRRVATNMDLWPERCLSSKIKTPVIRLPDFPKSSDFEALGKGCDDPKKESTTGVVVLDECATYFNAREWQDKDRPRVILWMRHARKLGWDVILITQDEESVDAQVRRFLDDMHVSCTRLDRLSGVVLRWVFAIAAILTMIGSLWMGGVWKFVSVAFAALWFVSKFYNLTGWLPRFHLATVRYKKTPIARWSYRGQDVQEGYETAQLFNPETSPAMHSVLSPWHLVGRFQPAYDWHAFRRVWWFRWLPALLGQCSWVPVKMSRRPAPVSRVARTVYFPFEGLPA